MPSLGSVFQTTFIIALAVFGLLHQLSGSIVAVGSNFAVPAGFLDQVVGQVVIETVGFAVFVGEDGQTAGFVVGVGEGMAQRVGAFERQSVHCEFVGGFGTESVDVGGQPVEAVVFEGFVTAVGIVGTDGVARCVVAALSVGVDAVDKFVVFVETVHFRPSQCVGNDGMVFAVVERPFFAEVVAALEHFAVGVVTVVFVAGHQSVGLAVFDHDVVAVGKTAQFFAVASVNGGQIAVA